MTTNCRRPELITVILSTYNAPAWLEKSLWGYACQTYRDFEVVIADDGSGPETADLIERMREQTQSDVETRVARRRWVSQMRDSEPSD